MDTDLDRLGQLGPGIDHGGQVGFRLGNWLFFSR